MRKNPHSPLVIDADVAAALAALRRRAIAWGKRSAGVGGGNVDIFEAFCIVYELTSPQFDVLNQEAPHVEGLEASAR